MRTTAGLICLESTRSRALGSVPALHTSDSERHLSLNRTAGTDKTLTSVGEAELVGVWWASPSYWIWVYGRLGLYSLRARS